MLVCRRTLTLDSAEEDFYGPPLGIGYDPKRRFDLPEQAEPTMRLMEALRHGTCNCQQRTAGTYVE